MHYRLGDILTRNIDCPTEGTIGDQYKKLQTQLEHKNINYGSIISIIEKEKYKYIKPADDVVVVHLRVGDVLELLDLSVDDFLDKTPNQTAQTYVYNLEYYKNILKKLPTSIKNIVFAYGNHKPEVGFKKSTEYIKKLKNFFESKGYNVMTRSNEDADLDFVYMCNSKHFVKSGGQFSSIIADLVKLKGNNIYYNTWNLSKEAKRKRAEIRLSVREKSKKQKNS